MNVMPDPDPASDEHNLTKQSRLKEHNIQQERHTGRNLCHPGLDPGSISKLHPIKVPGIYP